MSVSQLHDYDQEPSAPMDWDDLRAAVVDHHGVYRIDMGQLRRIGGYGRLGINVRMSLSATLAGIGIGHLPAELPPDQQLEVVLFQYGTPAAEVVAAIRGGDTAGAESALLHLNSSGDMERVREAAVKASEILTVLSDRCRGCLGPMA
jgi:hypothetical protein